LATRDWNRKTTSPRQVEQKDSRVRRLKLPLSPGSRRALCAHRRTCANCSDLRCHICAGQDVALAATGTGSPHQLRQCAGARAEPARPMPKPDESANSAIAKGLGAGLNG
jgi:hypothetical protein